MDTPACLQPRDSQEQEILDGLVLLRDKLLLLKRDNSTHMKSQDVLDLYDELVGLVRQLGEIRATHPFGSEETQRECFDLRWRFVPCRTLLC